MGSEPVRGSWRYLIDGVDVARSEWEREFNRNYTESGGRRLGMFRMVSYDGDERVAKLTTAP